jgi:hypothetical protein
MTREPRRVWGGSLHTPFRLLPKPLGHLKPFLNADGKTPEDVLKALPYDSGRSKTAGKMPDAKRYRDPRQIYQAAGLLYEGEDGLIHLTDLGKATLRWIDMLTPKNVVILGRHAAYALSACQLRNPIGVHPYDTSVVVFPFAFIWRAMVALDRKISSDELNRAIFKVTNEAELDQAIRNIADARDKGDLSVMGEETVTGEGKNDRIIPWLSIASFGWTLISDKRTGEESGYYRIPDHTLGLIREAAAIRHNHREFTATKEYVERIARAAALPQDLR